MARADVLLVSLGATAGLREADAELAASLRRAGGGGGGGAPPALPAPRRGAIRFDAPAAGNRPGRHGAWQRPVERRRFAHAPLLVPWSDGALAEAPRPHAP